MGEIQESPLSVGIGSAAQGPGGLPAALPACPMQVGVQVCLPGQCPKLRARR